MYRYYVRKFRDIEEVVEFLGNMNEGHCPFDVISIIPCNYVITRFIMIFRVLQP